MKYHDKIKIEGVYDSNIDKLGEDFFKMKIKNGKQLGMSANKDVNIIIASMAFRDIEDSLRGKGFEKYIFICLEENTNYNIETGFNMEELV